MIFEKVKGIILDTLSCAEEAITLEATLTEDLGADSLDAVELNMALEEAFEVSIPDEDGEDGDGQRYRSLFGSAREINQEAGPGAGSPRFYEVKHEFTGNLWID